MVGSGAGRKEASAVDTSLHLHAPRRVARALGTVAVAVVVAVSGLEVSDVPGARAHHFTGRACPQHVTQGYQARVRYIHCEEDRINPPGTGAFAVGVARCESGIRGNVYQHLERYWPGRFRKWTGSEYPLDGSLRPGLQAFRTNVIVTFRMARAVGWSPWTCAGMV